MRSCSKTLHEDVTAGLGQSALSGAFWLSLSSWILRFANLFIAIFLARILTTKEYGLVVFAMLILGMFEVVGTLGLQAAVVQRPGRIDDDFLNVSWTYDRLLVKSIGAVLVCWGAPYIASFFNEPRMVNIIRAISGILIFQAFENNAMTVLTKNLEYHRRVCLEISNALMIVLTVIPLALALRNAWAVVAAYGMGQIARTICSYLIYQQIPRIRFNWSILKELFPFGKWIVGLLILTRFREQLDKIILGKLLGTESLGFFQVGGRISSQLVASITQTSNKVLFPIYSKMQHDAGLMARNYKLVLQLVAFFSFPISLFMMVAAEPLIIFLFGAKWASAASVMKIMAFAGALRIIVSTSYPMLRGHGRPELEFIMCFSFLLVLLPLALYLTPRYGISGTAYAILIAELFQTPIWLWFLHKTLGIAPAELIKTLSCPAIVTSVTWCTQIILKNYLVAQSCLIQVLVQFTSASIVYITLLGVGWYYLKWNSLNLLLANFKGAIKVRSFR